MFAIVFMASSLAFGNHIRYPFSDNAVAEDSPSDRITDQNIRVFSDRAIIEKDDLIWAKIKDTHSMEPVLSKDSTSLELPPKSTDEIQVGDIISFEQGEKVIIHRVILVSQDESGWFAATKGDNNPEPDPYKVRFSQIQGIVVGILY
jgi:hypothetical protein